MVTSLGVVNAAPLRDESRRSLTTEPMGSSMRGGPPYIVRWDDTGHETLFFPGSDAVVEHFDHEAVR
jgi:hypothetical protein